MEPYRIVDLAGHVSEECTEVEPGVGELIRYDEHGLEVHRELVPLDPPPTVDEAAIPPPIEIVRAEMLTAYEEEMASGPRSMARIDAAIRAALGARGV